MCRRVWVRPGPRPPPTSLVRHVIDNVFVAPRRLPIDVVGLSLPLSSSSHSPCHLYYLCHCYVHLHYHHISNTLLFITSISSPLLSLHHRHLIAATLASPPPPPLPPAPPCHHSHVSSFSFKVTEFGYKIAMSTVCAYSFLSIIISMHVLLYYEYGCSYICPGSTVLSSLPLRRFYRLLHPREPTEGKI
ncbi:hypothetical protein BDQ12DRAFT_473849 [Crucibulum laeve]|uniref:Uncharacterized protein n=1 Tax=Crucibulum laeve TaxID=68775 RepID=A0A5C3LI90_9AGAR|nr:hypothetical protein BDQ12DRAFT_473849 [Crucibulum laeve]